MGRRGHQDSFPTRIPTGLNTPWSPGRAPHTNALGIPASRELLSVLQGLKPLTALSERGTTRRTTRNSKQTGCSCSVSTSTSPAKLHCDSCQHWGRCPLPGGTLTTPPAPCTGSGLLLSDACLCYTAWNAKLAAFRSALPVSGCFRLAGNQSDLEAPP